LTVSVDPADRKVLRRLLTSSDERTSTLCLAYVVRHWASFAEYAETEYSVFNDFSRRAPARPVLSVLLTSAGLNAAFNYYAESPGERYFQEWIHEFGYETWANREQIRRHFKAVGQLPPGVHSHGSGQWALALLEAQDDQLPSDLRDWASNL